MNLFQRLLARFTGNTLSTYMRRGMKIPGVHITNDSALQSAVLWAGITWLSRTTASCPWRVLKPREGGGADQQHTHPVNRLLNVRPNPEMGPFTFKETMIGYAVNWGNGLAEIQVDNRNIPVALWPLHPDRIQYKRSSFDGRMQYQVDGTEEPFWLEASQVFHLRGYGTGAVGLNVMEYAASSVGWARATEIFGAAYFSEGMRPSGVYQTKAKLTVEALEGLRKLLKGRNGPRGTIEPLIVDGDGTWKPESIVPEEAQFIETRQHQIEEMCRWLGVPPHKVMHLLRATFSNIEHQSIEAVQDSILPWAIRLEEEGNWKLFGDNRQGFYTKIDLKGLLRGDFASRTAGYTALWNMGALSTNDILLLEDMNPIGKVGDKRVAPLNMTTLEKLGEEPKKALQPPDESGEDDDDPDEDLTPVERARKQRAMAQKERDVGENARTSAMLAGIQVHAGILAEAISQLPAPVVNVAGTNVRIEPQTINLPASVVNVEASTIPAPQVTVQPAEVTVHNQAAPAPNVEVHPPTIHMEATVLNLPPTEVTVHVAAPTVNIEPAQVTVDAPVTVEGTVVNVDAPKVTVNPKLEANLSQKNSKTTHYRDENGDLVESVTEYR